MVLTGSELGWAARAFVGWFGPRGLASVVFGLLAVEELGQTVARPVVSAIGITVMLSVVAHPRRLCQPQCRPARSSHFVIMAS
jgi:sodium/hydrogen antiporter